MTKADTAIKLLEEKFTSGNDIPVDRAAITREEFEALKSLVQDMITLRHNMNIGLYD